MASGVTVHPDCLTTFQALKTGRKYKFVIFTLNGTNTEVIVHKTSDSTDYADFVNELPDGQCRWAVYDFEFEKEGAGKRNKICFVSWSPDDAKVKDKMVYASSKDALRRALVGLAVEIQGTDHSEVAYESVLEKANRGH